MLRRLHRAWQAWQLQRGRIPVRLWQAVTRDLHALRGLSEPEDVRLRALASLFLREKTISGAGALEPDERMRTEIAALASLPILELDLGWYDGWHEVVVYDETFVVEHEEMDTYGVVHRVRRPLAGESWGEGPVILSWGDWQHERAQPGSGHNVIIHEFAHKLDMRNGAANGMPPLHPDMERRAWTETFTAAWERLQHRLEHHHKPWIDPYAATAPAEFFAVASEVFFEAPWRMHEHEPALYAQMRQFYRQDPLARQGHR
ncbi:MAG: zinc-dependent peptidase [Gammaproteobacteria bacterium]|nr:MAG: zinc-dependent peptidase [Gammaproteobacteria bacterium]